MIYYEQELSTTNILLQSQRSSKSEWILNLVSLSSHSNVVSQVLGCYPICKLFFEIAILFKFLLLYVVRNFEMAKGLVMKPCSIIRWHKW